MHFKVKELANFSIAGGLLLPVSFATIMFNLVIDLICVIQKILS